MEWCDQGNNKSLTQLQQKEFLESVPAGLQVFDRSFTVLLGLLMLACSFSSISLNLLAFQFFRKRTTTFKFKLIFSFAACVDILISCLSPLSAASFLDERKPLMFSQKTFCQLWGFLWSYASKLSANIVGITGILRVLLIFFRSGVAVKKIKILMITAALVLLFLESLTFLYGEEFSFQPYSGSCNMGLVALKYLDPISAKGLVLSYLPALAYSLPIPISFCSYLLSCSALCHHNCFTRTQIRPRNDRNFTMRAIVTLTSFMAAYLLLQVPLAVYIIFLVMRGLSPTCFNDAFVKQSWLSFYMPHLVYVFSVTVNAAVNPVIYYWRMQEFRIFVNEKISRAFIKRRYFSSSSKKRTMVSQVDVEEWRREMMQLETCPVPGGEEHSCVPIQQCGINVCHVEDASSVRNEQTEEDPDGLDLLETTRLIEQDDTFFEEVLNLATQEMKRNFPPFDDLVTSSSIETKLPSLP